RDRRALGHLSRLDPDRHPCERHVLRRRSHPLRPLRWIPLHDLRRDLLLVPENDRTDVQRAAREDPLLADVHRLQRHLLPDALARAPRDASPCLRLRRPVREPELHHQRRVIRARRLDDRLPLQHDRQLAPRPDRAGEPLARAHARVASVLSAAGLQLRRDPAGRRQPVRVRRPRCPACRSERGPCRGPGRRKGGLALMGEPRHILVVANETVAGKSLIDALRSRAEEGPIRVTVISPQNEPRAGFVVYAESRRSSADRRLRRTLDLLHEAGIAARGAVVDPNPLQAIKDAIYEYDPDEIIISTHPGELKSSWLRANLIARARKVTDKPVEHVVVDLESPREQAHILVLANQTVLGQP